MNFKLMMLENIVKWLTSADLMNNVKQMVFNASNKNMTGAEKRQYVFDEAMRFFGEFSVVFINLAIEVAVLVLKQKYGEIERGA